MAKRKRLTTGIDCVIISNSRRFIFVHLHKTAGTAITRELETSLDWNDISIAGSARGNVEEGWFRNKFELEMHSSASSIRSVVGDEIWYDYFTFSFVRDPYRRILSLYTWLEGLVKAEGIKRIARHMQPESGIWAWPGTKAYLETNSFSEFIRHPIILSEAPAARPMVESLYDGDKMLVNFIGKVETLDCDIEYILRRVGLGFSRIPSNNTSMVKSNPNEYYKKQSDLDMIYERYQEDFQKFSYSRLKIGEFGD